MLVIVDETFSITPEILDIAFHVRVGARGKEKAWIGQRLQVTQSPGAKLNVTLFNGIARFAIAFVNRPDQDFQFDLMGRMLSN